MIEELLEEILEDTLKEYWETDCIDEDRLTQWCRMVASSAESDSNIDCSLVWKVLLGIFPHLEKTRKNSGEKEKFYVYNTQDNSSLRVAEERTHYGDISSKVKEAP